MDNITTTTQTSLNYQDIDRGDGNPGLEQTEKIDGLNCTLLIYSSQIRFKEIMTENYKLSITLCI
jgi:hypothetical protein